MLTRRLQSLLHFILAWATWQINEQTVVLGCSLSKSFGNDTVFRGLFCLFLFLVSYCLLIYFQFCLCFVIYVFASLHPEKGAGHTHSMALMLCI